MLIRNNVKISEEIYSILKNLNSIQVNINESLKEKYQYLRKILDTSGDEITLRKYLNQEYLSHKRNFIIFNRQFEEKLTDLVRLVEDYKIHRMCFNENCKRVLDFKDYFMSNLHRDLKEITDLWFLNDIEFYCCQCNLKEYLRNY